MKRWAGFTLLFILVLLAACASRPAKTFVWQRVDTDVEVTEDGRLVVTETLTLRYTGGPFTWVARDLPSRHLDRITAITVSEGEQSYRQVDNRNSKEPYTFSIFPYQGTTRVRWVHPETLGGERTFTLRYEVEGAVARYADTDEIWWPFVFPAREEMVEQASGTIRLPASVPVEQLDATMPDVQGIMERTPGMVSVRASHVPPGQKLTVELRFPKGILGGEEPAWQVAAAAQEQYDITVRPTLDAVLAALTAGLLLIGTVLIRNWWRRNRDPRPAFLPIESEIGQPPDELTPALVAKLLGMPDGEALVGTLFDLARRGYLTLYEARGGLWNIAKQVKLARTEKPADDLAPFEAASLDALLASEPEVILNKRQFAIQKALPKLGKAYQAALVERGYLSEAGLARRKRGLAIGAVLLALGLVSMIPAAIFASRYSWWLLALAGGLFLIGLAWLITTAFVRGVTPAGAEALAGWRAFQRYLKRIRPERAPLGQFEPLFPYAAAIANARRFIKAFQFSNEPLPAWFHPLDRKSGRDAWEGVSGVLLLRDFSDGVAAAAASAAASSGAASGGGGAGGGAGGGSAG